MISYVNLANYLDVADRQLSAICKEAMAVGLGTTQPLSCVRSTVLPEMRCKNSLNHSSIRNEHCCVSALENAKPCPVNIKIWLVCLLYLFFDSADREGGTTDVQGCAIRRRDVFLSL